MEQPLHSIRTQMDGTPEEIASCRAGSLALVIAIQAGVVALLIYGVAPDKMERKLQDLTTTIEDKVEVKAPPPPVDTAKPPPPFVPPPEFQIATEAPPSTNAITTTSTRPPAPPSPPSAAAPPVAPPTAPVAILATHTLPPYPAISLRLGEHGTVLLTITISANGDCTDASVATSSGSPRLDKEAIDYVKSNYKWKPATKDGKPIDIRSQIQIRFDLNRA